MAIEEEEKLQEIKVTAERKFGRKWEDLTPEEKENMYRDYAGERDVANAKYASGESQRNTELGDGIMAGNVYVGRGMGNAVSVLANKWAGRRKQDKADERLAKLSEQRQSGAQAAGEVAQTDARRIEDKQDRMSNRLIDLMSKSNAPKAPTPSAPGAGGGAVPKRATQPPPLPVAGEGEGFGVTRSSANPPAGGPPMASAGAPPSPPPGQYMDSLMESTKPGNIDLSLFPEKISPEMRQANALAGFDKQSGFDKFKEVAGDLVGMTPAAAVTGGVDSAVKSATGMSVSDLAKMGIEGGKLEALLKKLGIGR